MWKELNAEHVVQLLQLGLFRSDYLLHSEQSSSRVSLKQVEINTMCVAFGSKSQTVSYLHKYLCSVSGFFESPHNVNSFDFPPNNSRTCLAEGLAAAHAAYGDVIPYITPLKQD